MDSNLDIFQYIPPVPHDHIELEKIAPLMAKLPELKNQLEDLGKGVAQGHGERAHPDLEMLVFMALFTVLEDREYQAPSNEYRRRLGANFTVDRLIRRRKPPCEICGENRSTDRCHIVPNRLGGPLTSDNLLILCPTHHRLFDRFLLSRPEVASIDWERKSEAAQKYFELTIIPSHELFWSRVEAGNHSRPPLYEMPEDRAFVGYIVDKVVELFPDARPIRRRSVYRLVAPHIREVSKTVVSSLVDEGILVQTKVGTVAYLARPSDRPSVTDAIRLRVWQKL